MINFNHNNKKGRKIELINTFNCVKINMPEIEIDFDLFFPSEHIFKSYIEILKVRNFAPQIATMGDHQV